MLRYHREAIPRSLVSEDERGITGSRARRCFAQLRFSAETAAALPITA
jgi:hypothetical protein